MLVPVIANKVFDDLSQDDVLQEILTAVSQQLPSLATRDDPKCFVLAIAANKMRAYRRYHGTGLRKRLSYDSDAVTNAQTRASSVDPVEREDEYAILQEFISELPPELRVILELRFWQQQSLA